MKKFFKTAAMPMAVFAIAIGSAFATNAFKNEQVESAYQRIDSQGLTCIVKEESCTPEQTPELCTWFDGASDHDLYGMEYNANLKKTVCTKKLYKIE
ncbi:DUF6520 family protein [Myroides sp. C8-3]|uniref:DUF6520 family protein n=1 Tax=Myroides sp. C8-3 TaxID=3400533 RepID=UPI003D2F8023